MTRETASLSQLQTPTTKAAQVSKTGSNKTIIQVEASPVIGKVSNNLWEWQERAVVGVVAHTSQATAFDLSFFQFDTF